MTDPDLSRAEFVYGTLLQRILQRQLPPGSLLREVPIAEELGVSRTPVHEALRQLVHDGLVVRASERRMLVARATREEVFDLFEMRLILEVEATRRAAHRIDRPTLESLHRKACSLEKEKTLARFRRDWSGHDEALHSGIAGACGSRRLRDDILRYRLWHQGLNAIPMEGNRLRQAAAEHRAITEALLERDGETAAEAMRRHLQEWQAIFVAALETGD